MYKKFTEYKDQKSLAEFDAKLNELCARVVFAGIDPDEYWTEHMFPALINAHMFADDMHLLDHLLSENTPGSFPQMPYPSNWAMPINKNSYPEFNPQFLATNMSQPDVGMPQGGPLTSGQMRNLPSTPDNPFSSKYNPNAPTDSRFDTSLPMRDEPQPGTAPSANAGNPQMDKQKADKLAKFQNQVNDAIMQVKKRFNMNLDDMVKRMADEAHDKNNPMMWKVANLFKDHMGKALGKFNINAAYKGQGSPNAQVHNWNQAKQDFAQAGQQRQPNQPGNSLPDLDQMFPAYTTASIAGKPPQNPTMMGVQAPPPLPGQTMTSISDIPPPVPPQKRSLLQRMFRRQ